MNSSKMLIYSFFSGVLYLFGLSENPIEKVKKNRVHRDDFQNIQSDWHKVGQDIRKAYGKATATS